MRRTKRVKASSSGICFFFLRRRDAGEAVRGARHRARR